MKKIILYHAFLFIILTGQLNAQKIELNKDLIRKEADKTSKINEDFVQGILYFKIKDDRKEQFQIFETNIQSENDNYKGDLFLSQIKLISIRRPFERLGGNLSKIYEVKFSDYSATQDVIRYLSELPYVEYCEKVPAQHENYCSNNDSASISEYQLDLMEVCKSWDFAQGEDIVIAFIDDAFKVEHEDLRNSKDTNLVEFLGVAGVDDDNNGYIDDFFGWDFAENDNDVEPSTLRPYYAEFHQHHGTLVAGAAISEEGNGKGVSAIAPKAKGMFLKYKGLVFDPDPFHGGYLPVEGWNFTNEAICYAMENGADIINMSFGTTSSITPYDTLLLTTQLLLKAADSMGILLVAAAGNESNSGLSQLPFPARMPEVIAVGSTDEFDRKSILTNYDFNVDIAAPGSNILGPKFENNTAYSINSGTSISSPIVAGVLALIKSNNPSLTKEQVRTCLFNSADDLSSSDPVYGTSFGHGRVNALRAVQCLKSYSANFTIEGHASVLCTKDTLKLMPFNDYDDDTVKYEWYFGDGSILKSDTFSSSVSHIYQDPGTYSVELIILDKNNKILDRELNLNWLVVEDCINSHIQQDHTIWNFGKRVSLNFSTGKPISLFNETHNYKQDQTGDYRSSSRNNFAGRGGIGSYNSNVTYGALDLNYVQDSAKVYYSRPGQKSIISLPYPNDINKHIYVYASGDVYQSGLKQFGLSFSIDTKSNSPTSDVYSVIGTPSSYLNSKGEQRTASVITASKKCEEDAYWIVTHNAEDNPDTSETKYFTVLELVPSSPDFDKIRFVRTDRSNILMNDGMIKFSPKGNYIGVGRKANYYSLFESTHVFNFNKTTGEITPFKIYDLGYKYFEFSSNERFLYVYSDSANSVYQIDMQDPNPITQIVRLVQHVQVSGLQMGPDGRIYLEGTDPSKTLLSYIARPDVKQGQENECGWMFNHIDLNKNNSGGNVAGGFGFPNVVVASKTELDITSWITCDTVVLSIDPNQLECGFEVEWEFNGQSASGLGLVDVAFGYSERKSYSLKVKNGAYEYVKTIDLRPKIEASNLLIYPGSPVQMDLINPLKLKNPEFKWYRNGMVVNTDTNYMATATPGEYWLEVNGDCGHFVTNKITLKMDCNVTMNESYADPEYIFNPGPPYIIAPVTTPGTSNAYHVSGIWRIHPGATVDISSTHLIFDEGAEIIVEPEGHLRIHNTILSSCGRWKGITVIGEPSTGAGRLMFPPQIHGSLALTGSLIEDASCAVHSKDGGMVVMLDNEFGKNNMHLAFTDYDFDHLSSVNHCQFSNIDVYNSTLDTNYKPGLLNINEDTLAGVYLKNVDSITFVLDTILYNPYPKDFFNDCNVYMGVYLRGNASNPIKKIRLEDNSFPLSRLNYGCYMIHSDDVVLRENKFGEYILYPLEPTYYLPSPVPEVISKGIYSQDASSLKCYYNLINSQVDGLQVYIDNTLTQDTIFIIGNDFNGNGNALVISPIEHPLNNDYSKNNSGNNIEAVVRCNELNSNNIGIVGSGNLINQGSATFSHDNYCSNNVEWDIIWGNGNPSFLNFYSGYQPNFPSSLSKPIKVINGSPYDQSNNTWIEVYTSTIDPCLPLSIHPNSIKVDSSFTNWNDLNVYPNPFKDQLYIEYKYGELSNFPTMFNINGKLINCNMQLLNGKVIVNTQNLPKGVYIIHVKLDGNNTNVKVVKF